MFKVGDMIKCEYLPGEFSRGRVLEINGNNLKVEIAITSRRNPSILKDVISVDESKVSYLIQQEQPEEKV